MYLRIFFLFCLLPVISSFNGKDLKKIKVADGITVMLPEDFYPMSPDHIAQRYPSIRKPIAAYTNSQGMVDFSVNLSATQWRDGDIEMAKSFLKASILNMFDKVNMIQEDIREINGHKFIVFEVETRIDGDRNSLANTRPIRKYSYLQYLLINGKMIVFSFHSPIQLQDQWQDTAMEVMESVKVSRKI